MCEVTCTHVGYSKMTMGGDARWKKEGVAAMWVNIHKHAVSRGDVTTSQLTLLVSTCTSSVYITFHFSLFSLCFFPCFFLSFFLTCSFFTTSSYFLSLFRHCLLSLLIFSSMFSFFLPLLSFYIYTFRTSFLVFPIFSSFLQFFIRSFSHFLSCLSHLHTDTVPITWLLNSSSLHSRYAAQSRGWIIVMSPHKYT